MDSLQIENMYEKINKELKNFNKISTILVMKKYNLSENKARKICQSIWLDRHLEARKLALGMQG